MVWESDCERSNDIITASIDKIGCLVRWPFPWKVGDKWLIWTAIAGGYKLQFHDQKIIRVTYYRSQHPLPLQDAKQHECMEFLGRNHQQWKVHLPIVKTSYASCEQSSALVLSMLFLQMLPGAQTRSMILLKCSKLFKLIIIWQRGNMVRHSQGNTHQYKLNAKFMMPVTLLYLNFW